MLKRIFLLILLILWAAPLFAQSVDTAWVRRYDGPEKNNDAAYAIAADASGNVYVTGTIVVDGEWPDYIHDCATIKYDTSGNELWVKRYNGAENNCGSDIAVDASGNIYVTGYSYDGDMTSGYITIKYYPNGDTAWVRTYSSGFAFAIALDRFNNVCVTGAPSTIKYDSSGNELWVKQHYGLGDGSVVASAIDADTSGNIYVTGFSHVSGRDNDYATIKYYPNGDTAWVRRYNGPANDRDEARAIAVDPSGYIYVAGFSAGNGTDQDYATVKYDSMGNELWVRRYNGPANSSDWLLAMAVDAFDNVYVTGESYGGIETSYDCATIKYDSSGNELWVKRYNGPGNEDDWFGAITTDSSGNVYVTGASFDSVTRDDYATIKYSSSGDEIWIKTYNGPADASDHAFAITLDACGNVYVTGASLGIGTDADYATIKYVQKETFVEEEKDQTIAQSFVLHQNYPNPFNPETKIEYYLSEPTRVSLTIYNILGQKIRVLLDEFQTQGIKSITWDGKDNLGRIVASGIYFYRLKSGSYVESRKMLLLK